MNNTNRALNRIFTALLGLLTLLVGGAIIAVATVPGIRAAFRKAAPATRDDVIRWLKSIPLFGSGTSWGWIAFLAVLVLIVVLLLFFIFRQGGGRHDLLFTEETTPEGSTVIDADLAEHAVQHDLGRHPELLTSRVSTYEVNDTAVLKIAVTCRRGVSPRDVTTAIEDTLTALDALLGREVPALIHISGGFRVRLSRSTRVQQGAGSTTERESFA
jgi:hypothetical protein